MIMENKILKIEVGLLYTIICTVHEYYLLPWEKNEIIFQPTYKYIIMLNCIHIWTFVELNVGQEIISNGK